MTVSDRSQMKKELKTLLKFHRKELKAIFGKLKQEFKHSAFGEKQFHCFAVNYAVRTMLTLPTVLANCLNAALDLNGKRTAYGALTAAEEGGGGKAENVHATLMMDALNTHGFVCYGMRAIDLNKLIRLVRLWHVAKQLREAEASAATGSLPERWQADLDGTRSLCQHLARLCTYAGIRENGVQPAALQTYEQVAQSYLCTTAKIENSTLYYCSAQLDALLDPRPGYIQGVGYALEGLADTAMKRIFGLFYLAYDKYSSRDECRWRLVVYPYFAAHGPYWEKKLDKTVGQGVENEHEKREIEKLNELDDYSFENALLGAKHFAERNYAVWHGIKDAIAG